MVSSFEDRRASIIKLELGPFGTNAYIVTCKATRESVLVDAPGEPDRIVSQLAGTHPRYLLITHSHSDHIEVLGQLKSELEIPVAIHPLDATKLRCQPDIDLHDGELISVGLLKIKVLHTPGHTPGSTCFIVSRYLLAGDTIFPGGPGSTRTAADFKQIVESIKTKILVLPDETEILPGHGESSLLATEKRAFSIFASRHRVQDLHGDVLWLSS